jgi:hypothetical protein
MVVLDGNFAVGCVWAWDGLPLNTYVSINARTNEGLEPITFVLAHPTVIATVYLLRQPGSPIHNQRQHSGRCLWPHGIRRRSVAALFSATEGSNPAGGMAGCRLCVVEQKSLRRTDPSFRGVLSVVSSSVIRYNNSLHL